MSAPSVAPALDSTPLAPSAAEDLYATDPPVPVQQASVGRRVASGTGALALGIFLERGSGFVANILAARLGGAETFGAYSLAIGTANNISTYAAGGIGATAARFSGKYPFGSSSYATLARVLALVACVSALLAAAALGFGASPIAHLLRKPALAGLLRWAAVSAAGIIVLECARGFFVGQRRLAAVLALSMLVGAGMLMLLPWTAASHNASRMITVQGCITLGAVACCLLFAGPLRLRPAEFAAIQTARPPAAAARMVREVWGFGLVQLGGMVCANLAGWWLMAMVARADTTLVQMSFFAIASQLRNLAGLAPGLLTEGSYAVMADPAEEHLRTPHRVMAVCTFAATAAALLLAALGIVLVPWMLATLYGAAYRGAGLTAAIALGVAVVHMGNAPAAARLSIVSIRSSGVINTAWAAAVGVAGTLLLRHGGSAAMAMGIFFGAHALSAALVLIVLAVKDHVPSGMVALYLLGTGTTLGLLALAVLRAQHSRASLRLGAAMLCVLAAAAAGAWTLAKRRGWLPSAAAVREMKRALHAGARRALQDMLRAKERPTHAA